MTEPEELHPDDVQHHLREVQELLARQKVVEDLVHRQDMPRHALVENLVHKQHEAGLRAKLESLHPADIAYVLEALPLDDRLYVWDLVKAERDGEILLEVSDAVRESLIQTMDPEELKAAAESLDADELADLAPDLPPEVIEDGYHIIFFIINDKSQSLSCHQTKETIIINCRYSTDFIISIFIF